MSDSDGYGSPWAAPGPGQWTPPLPPGAQGPGMQVPGGHGPVAWGQAPPTAWGQPAGPVAVPGQWSPPSVLRVNAKAVLWSGWMMTPGVKINGTPVAARWGDNDYPVAPGRYRVDLVTNYLYPMGVARIDVDVPPHAAVTVFYAAPAGVFFPGAAGTTPQRTPGMWLTWVSVGLSMLILLLVILGAIGQALAG